MIAKAVYKILHVTQGFILERLFFIVYVNDLPTSFKMSNLIVLVDDTNLFHEHQDVIKTFDLVNEELKNMNEWFMSKKLSLNVGKTKYSLFHKYIKMYDLPLKLLKINVNNEEIKRKYYAKFLGVLLDENLSRRKHLKQTENKIAKSNGLIH